MGQCLIMRNIGAKENLESLTFQKFTGKYSTTHTINSKVYCFALGEWHNNSTPSLQATLSNGQTINLDTTTGYQASGGSSGDSNQWAWCFIWINMKDYKDEVIESIRVNTGSGDSRQYTLYVGKVQ